MTYDDHLMHCAVAKHIIDTFRNNNPEIVKLWGECGRALPFMLQDDSQLDEYPFTIGQEPVLGVGFESIWLPNGMRLAYPHLKCSSKGEYSTMKRKGNKIETSKVYGGLVTENVVQALARIVITDAMTRMREEGMRVVLTTHDEIVVVTPEEKAEEVFTRMGEIMSIRPDWQPSLPLACEGGWARNYSK
jgi:DNA polymerase